MADMFIRKFLRILTALMLPMANMTSASSNNEDMVYWQKDSRGNVTFFADNPHPIPYTVEIKFDSLVNLNPSQKPPFVFTLKANSSNNRLFNVKADRRSGYSFSTSTLVLPGFGVNTRHQDDHRYLLPFEHGQKYLVGQGYFGNATHKSPNPYAIDFNMDTGTVVCAARAGIVSKVKQDSNKGGPDPKYAKYGNQVTIFHSDGTFGNYVHLKKNGALVKVGDIVKAGQPIALSGNTGQSSGPHLHFEVNAYNAKGEPRNIPVKFVTHEQLDTTLNQGQFYYARHPGKPAFKVEIGADMSNKDVIQISKTAFTDSFEITTENVDDTVVLYANNGTQSTIDYELTLKLDNIKSSKTSPIKASVKPLTKQFVTLLKPISRDKPSQYAYSIKQRAISPPIDDSKYANHKKPIKQNNTIKVVSKQVDDKVLLFAQNGYKRTKTLTITLKISNLRPSKGQQQTLTLAPLTEVYLQHLAPINTTKDSELGWALEWR